MEREIMTGICIKGEERFNFEFYTDITVLDKMNFVNIVTDAIVNDGYYNSIIFDLMFNYTLIKFFTNIDTSFIEINEDGMFLNNIEDFINNSNVVDVLKSNIKDNVINELKNASLRNIEYKTGVHINPIFTSISELIDTLTNKFKNIDTNSLMEFVQKFNNDVLSITPESIVSAYVDSDYFKEKFSDNKEEK